MGSQVTDERPADQVMPSEDQIHCEEIRLDGRFYTACSLTGSDRRVERKLFTQSHLAYKEKNVCAYKNKKTQTLIINQLR